jgi:signal transduction histidine kinase
MTRTEAPLRYDDAVGTLLRQIGDVQGPAAASLFLNLLDLFAQNRFEQASTRRPEVFAGLRDLVDIVDPATVARGARMAAGIARPMQADLAAFLLGITRAGQRGWLSRLQLPADDWSLLLPLLEIQDLSLLKGRTDLAAALAARLKPLSSAQLLLPPPAPGPAPVEPALIQPETPAEPETAEIEPRIGLHFEPANDLDPEVVAEATPEESAEQIQLLLERIARFRDRREQEPPLLFPLGHELNETAVAVDGAEPAFMLADPLPAAPASGSRDLAILLADWRFETDRDGYFLRVGAGAQSDDAVAAGLPGLSGQRLEDWMATSPDAYQVQEALARRSAFRHARLEVESGPFAGRWLVSAVPAWAPASGHYLGHRGMAVQQPGLAQQPAADPLSQSTELLASLAHETRTPLNAIMGFAQMIDGQALGPVSEGYRAQSASILDASSRLIRALDDISESSRLDRGALAIHPSSFAAAELAEGLLAGLQPLFSRRSVTVSLSNGADLPQLWTDRDLAERCLERLIMAVLATAEPGEQLHCQIRAEARDELRFSVRRSRRLQTLGPDVLASPTSRDGHSPALAVGFALQLVERFAIALEGRFETAETSLDIIIPAMPQLAALRRRRQHP